MCGIFGAVISETTRLGPARTERLVREMFLASESRGREAAGIALRDERGLAIFKSGLPASRMIRMPGFKGLLDAVLARHEDSAGGGMAIVGHSRLVTDGVQQEHDNNQPVARDGVVGVHNGIVVNVDRLWGEHTDLVRRAEVDSEVLVALIAKRLDDGAPIVPAIRRTFEEIEGMASTALLFHNRPCLALATNNGSLYVCEGDDAYIFASERHILKQILRRGAVGGLFDPAHIRQVRPGEGRLVDIDRAEEKPYHLGDEPTVPDCPPAQPLPVTDASEPDAPRSPALAASRTAPDPEVLAVEFERCRLSIARLRRCARCVLPETFPHIVFDEQGVCNYCRHHSALDLKGKAAFEAVLAEHRKGTGDPDCVLAFSGGRDSSFALHLLKNEYGMTPLAFTYDWGMVTDLARRNQSRLCGKLGVEHILVSANIARKRDNIRRNVNAWLHRPNLGMVPLFMAGDKQFFYHAERIRRENGVRLILFAENLLEKTYFKSGFCGIRPHFESPNTYTLRLGDKLSLAAYYARRFVGNPGYLNRSLLDTLGAYLSYYAMPHHVSWMYQYLPWEESVVERTLLSEYDWELATDTDSSWRIGDGTAPFYNYIFYVMAGFTENDTFRSNQIREGRLDREQALRLVERDSKPRYESMRWYFQAIGVDMNEALQAVHGAPKLFNVG